MLFLFTIFSPSLSNPFSVQQYIVNIILGIHIVKFNRFVKRIVYSEHK